MKRLAALLFLTGLLVIALLVMKEGAGTIWLALSSIGWSGFALVLGAELVVFVLMGFAWQAIVEERGRAGLLGFVWARLVRDSGAEILPLSQVGGFVLGGRALALTGISTAMSIASTVVDVTLELFAQLAFTVLGLVLMLAMRPDSAILIPTASGFLLMSVAVAGFVIAQRRGFWLIDRVADHVLSEWVQSGQPIGKIAPMITAMYGKPQRIWLCSLLHLVCWLATAAEAWLALYLMGVRVSIGAVFAVESLIYAIRSGAFFVPNALGVQEGAYLLLASSFGISPQVILALSLLKRARDLTLGLPSLLSWQIFELKSLVQSTPQPLSEETP